MSGQFAFERAYMLINCVVHTAVATQVDQTFPEKLAGNDGKTTLYTIQTMYGGGKNIFLRKKISMTYGKSQKS